MITGGSVPAVPSCILAPIRDQFLALLPVREDRHPLGCHNPRISDALVFDRLVQVPRKASQNRSSDVTCRWVWEAPQSTQGWC